MLSAVAATIWMNKITLVPSQSHRGHKERYET